MRTRSQIVLTLCAFLFVDGVLAFEGRITATVTRGSQPDGWLYTVGREHLRIERTDTNRPHARNIVNLKTGDLTLLFPHNRSFVRLKDPGTQAPLRAPAGIPAGVAGRGALPIAPEREALSPPAAMPAPASAIGPTNLPDMPAMPRIPAMPQMPASIGPQAGASPGVPSMPMMPMMPMDKLDQPELKSTGQKTNLLGYACDKFELRQRGEVMEIWATDQLPPFQAWQPNQRPRFGPQMIEDQWGELLRAQRVFPLLAVLKFEHGPERLRFEVKSITPEKIEDADGALFQPPPDYHEIEPLPF